MDRDSARPWFRWWVILAGLDVRPDQCDEVFLAELAGVRIAEL